jgi:uncharacterized membrane protein
MVNAKRNIYWISTITLFSLLILTGIFYVAYYSVLEEYFIKYGFPTYLIYPLGIAKIIGSVVILYHKNKFLRELAYAGFLFNFVLAFFAHVMVKELDPFPTISMVLLLTSYFTQKYRGVKDDISL